MKLGPRPLHDAAVHLLACIVIQDLFSRNVFLLLPPGSGYLAVVSRGLVIMLRTDLHTRLIVGCRYPCARRSSRERFSLTDRKISVSIHAHPHT